MPARRKIEPFVLIVTDRDKREFTVEGPMVDDTPWNGVVVRAQEEGRQVNCHVPGGEARSSVRLAVEAYQREYGFTPVPPGSVVAPPGAK